MKIAYLGDFTDKYLMHRPQDLKRWSLIHRVGEMEGVDLKLIQVNWKDIRKDKNKYDSGKVVELLQQANPDLIYIINPRLNDDILYDVGKIYRNKLPIVMTCHDLWEPFQDLFKNWNKNVGLSHFIYIFKVSDIYIVGIENRSCKVNVYYDDINLFWYDNGFDRFKFIWSSKEFDIGRLGRLTANIRKDLENNKRIKRSWDNLEVLEGSKIENYINSRRIGIDYAKYIKNCRYYLCTPAGIQWKLSLMAASYIECQACGVIPYGVKATDKEAEIFISEIFFVQHNTSFKFDLKIEECYKAVKNNYKIIKERFSATSQAHKVFDFFKGIIL